MRELYRIIRNGREEWSVTPSAPFRAAEFLIFMILAMLAAPILQWGLAKISGWSAELIAPALGL